jgi:hypothetical protein
MLMKQKVWRSEIDFFEFFAESFGKALDKNSLPSAYGSALGTLDGRANGRHGRPVVL